MKPFRSRPRTALLAGVLAVSIALGATVLSGCSTPGAASGPAGSLAPGQTTAPTAVRLGYFANVTHAPALVALQKGFFKEKLGASSLEPKLYNAGGDAVTALLSDAIDITYVGPNPSINAYQKSKGEAVVVAGSTSGGASFVVKPEIDDATDLEGKTVSSPQLGNTQDVALRTWLKGKGLATDTSGGGDVSIKPQENADTLTAFKNGDIVGAWVPEPWATRLVLEGNGKVLVDEKSLWPGGAFATTDILVSKKFLAAHPDAVQAVLEAHLQSLDYIEANDAEAQALANAQIKQDTQKALPDAVIAGAWKNLQFTPDPLAASVQKDAADAKAIGQLKSDDVNGLYDLTILNELLKVRGRDAVKGLA